nr:hypothetical protein [uncultured Flavobacterium sp.]
MLIDRIYKKVKTFINTDVRGNVTPVEFNLFLHDAIQERQNELIGLINQHQNRANRGMSGSGLESLAENYREKLQHYLSLEFITTNTNGQITIPSQAVYIDLIENNNGVAFEQCSSYSDFRTQKPNATSDLPLSIRFGNTIETYPKASTQNVNISFVRKPIIPNWTYEVISGNELFNPSHTNFRDADAHPSEEDTLVVKVLKRFGINLKENEITAIASQTEQINTQQELTT